MTDGQPGMVRVAAVGVMVALAVSSVINHTDLPLNWGVLLAALLGVTEGFSKIATRKAAREEKEEKEKESET